MYEFACANLSYPQRYSYTPFGGLKFLNEYVNCRLEFLEKIKKLKFSNKKEISNKSKNYNFELELKFFEVHKRLFEKYELAYNLRKERILRAKSKDFNNSKKSISFPDGQNYNIDKLEDIYKYGTDIIKAFESRKC